MLSNRRLIVGCALVLLCNMAGIYVFIKYNIGEICYATIDEHQEIVAELPENFLSFGIDTSEIESYDKIDFENKRLRELAAALAPARLRLGGTMSERLIFSKDDVPVSCDFCPSNITKPVCHAVKKLCKHKPLPFFIMTGKKWIDINEFCKATDLNLLFSFNVLLRDQHNEWSEQNAAELLDFSRHHKYEADWQLGNEPNSFQHVFNVKITPQMLAKDFKKLRRLLNHYDYKTSLLVGPDTTRPQPHHPECLKYMVEFLGNASHSINIRSWHQYYLNGREAKLKDFWNPDTLNLLKEQIEIMKNHTQKYNSIPMWLTETSSAYGGGAPGLSNSFAGSPLWLDKLGLAAKYNITTLVRQSFIGGNYSLVDKDLEPLPDWWVSVLYKKVVGNRVLHVDCHCTVLQRMYMHCASRKYTKDSSAVTIYAVNLEMAKVKFFLNGTAFNKNNVIIDEYIISAPSNYRETKTVLLNGWPLHYESPEPDLQPNQIKHSKYISMPPYSIGFWVVKNTSIKVCS